MFVRAKEGMENAKRTYEILNSELHDELPALHDSRIPFLVTNMQTLFAAEEVFHSETAKVYSELEGVVDKLAKEAQRGTLPRKTFPKPLPITNNTANNVSNSHVITNSATSTVEDSPPPRMIMNLYATSQTPTDIRRAMETELHMTFLPVQPQTAGMSYEVPFPLLFECPLVS